MFTVKMSQVKKIKLKVFIYTEFLKSKKSMEYIDKPSYKYLEYI